MTIGYGDETTTLAAADAGEVYVQTSSWRLALRTFAENRLALLGVAIVVGIVLFCYVGPLVYHSDQVSANIAYSHQPPGAGHPLGTDELGFDELGRMMLGGQSSLEIGLVAAVLATVVGTLWGAFAGLVGGAVDGVMMRIVDVGLSIPTLFIILIIAIRFSSTVLSLAIVIGLNQWLVPSRLVRGEVLTLRVRDFVSAAKSMGATRRRLMMRHLIPNALGVVIVNVTFQIADAILFTSIVGYLGFGLHFPQVDWGDQLSNGSEFLYDGYWWLIYPVGIALTLLVMSFNFIGDAARDAVDVRLRRR
jgi:peptide/nickel transport system permease protein